MYTILGCLSRDHDWRLVVTAALICLVASTAAIQMWSHATETPGPSRGLWLLSAGAATGFGIWATHFISMLAYKPGPAVSYDLPLTLASLAAAIIITSLGLRIAAYRRSLAATLGGGAVVGLGIIVMHLLGMASFNIQGRMSWAAGLVILSFAAALLFAAISLAVAAKGHKLLAGTLLAVSVTIHHFVGMSAITILPDPTVAMPVTTYSAQGVATAIAGFATSLFGACIVMVLTGQRARAKLENVTQNLDLALSNMSQGLCLFDRHERLVLTNRRFAEIVKMDQSAFPTGLDFQELLRRVSDHYRNGTDIVADPFEPYNRHRRQHTRSAGIMVALGKEQILALTHNPIADGGWVTTCTDVTARLLTERRIAHMARHDSLTGLPNRAHLGDHLEDALARAQDSQSGVALFGIDLNRFKEINDQFGHATGDALLKLLATRMAAILQPGELIGRIGGDEFSAVKTFQDPSEVDDLLHRIETQIFKPALIQGIELAPTASIGIARYPDDAQTQEQLINNADLAMYRSKRTLGQTPCFYEADMDEAARLRRTLASDLWTAIERQEFMVHYQVQKSVRSGEITGYEALVRWRHPQRGMVSPADFIPVAEECGAIVKLGEWVLRQACADAVIRMAPHKIAVNLSPVQFNHPDLPGLVRKILRTSGLPATRLELEITETSIIADKQRALHILRQIKALGVSIAIDDFGTGYSSLDTLNAFPFDKIKIDRSFLVDADSRPQSKAIIRAVLALGQSLGIPVLAEGIETEAQLTMLRREGCQEGQGYLFGKPTLPCDVETSASDPAVSHFRSSAFSGSRIVASPAL